MGPGTSDMENPKENRKKRNKNIPGKNKRNTPIPEKKTSNFSKTNSQRSESEQQPTTAETVLQQIKRIASLLDESGIPFDRR